MTSQRVLIIDKNPMSRELLCGSLLGKSYRTSNVSNGYDALVMLDTTPPDLVILDLAIQGLDAVSLLRELRNHPRHHNLPVIILSDDSTKDHVLEVTRLGVQGYILKDSFSLERLLTIIRQTLSDDKRFPSSLEVAISTDGSATVDTIPPAPLRREIVVQRARKGLGPAARIETISEVIALTGSGENDANELATLLSSDQALATRVLQLANSAAFAPSKGKVVSVAEAVGRLGFHRIAELVARIGLIDCIEPRPEVELALVRCWRHSLGVVEVIGHIIDQVTPKAKGVGAFIGLCHNLGEMLLRQAFHKEFEAVTARAIAENRSFDELDRANFGVTSVELSALILDGLSLPRVLIQPIEEYSLINPVVMPNRMGRLSLMLLMADQYCRGIILGTPRSSRISPLSSDLVNAIAGSSGITTPGRDEVISSVESTIRTISRFKPEVIDQALSTNHKKLSRRICYIRHSSYSYFDPIQGALESMADVTVVNNVPGSWDQVKNYDRVVLVHPDCGRVAKNLMDLQSCGKNIPPVLWLTDRLRSDWTENRNPKSLSFPVSTDGLYRFVCEG